MKKSRKVLLTSALSLLLCFSMLLGTTFAWFTDSVTSTNNIIKSGNLDVELYYQAEGQSNWTKVTSSTNIFMENAFWEPGHTEVVKLKVVNEGSLALKYLLDVNVASEVGSRNVKGEDFKLSEYIYFGIVAGEQSYTREQAVAAVETTATKLNTPYNGTETKLLAKNDSNTDETIVTMVVYMPTWVTNEANHAKDAPVPTINLGINLYATQVVAESDSFGDDYDADSEWPGLGLEENATGSATVTSTDGKVDAVATINTNTEITATVPAGVAVDSNELTLTVAEKDTTDSGLTTGTNEELMALDVHVDGVSADNATPIIISLGKVLPVGMNLGNVSLYHVEDGVTNIMMQVDTLAEVDAHNEFYYDPATGDVTVAMATFSEVAVVADTTKAWGGKYDYTWYDANATELTIANADQLAAFGALVGGMAKDENGNFLITYTDSDGDEHHNDTFSGKIVKLISDVNLGDAEKENNPDIIFYPIGYWNSDGTYEKSNKAISSGFYAFEGTFDGNGNTISNFYQNTWEMKGDHDWYDATLQYFRDGMGLFGKVYGGTVKNLIVDNFSCDSEIGTTGVIAAYADSKDGKPAVFENISITNCNPRVYNIGNGGIVGCAGWYSRNESLGNADYPNAVTFRNITVDQTNKISALWGSWGVSCAGILGQYYPNSNCGIKLENCHVAAIIDVNNDVCSNYQYYWYRYAGMFIGTIRANTKDTNGYTVADTTGVTATDCTYTMGDWNEYWYCEIVANSLASYTHDHQFSRLTNIYDLSEIKSGDTWLKEGHFALLDENRDIVDCYHIFKDSEGNLYRHSHDVADESNPNIYETFDLNGDGELNDLKEDRQRYFIPFNQLLTGLDMGIKAHTEFEGIEFVEDGKTKSEVKFNATTNTEIPKNGTVNIGDLFIAKENVSISSPTVQVYVSPVGEGSTVSAIYSGNSSDWDKGTLTFSGTGSAKVVITDHFYCTKTVLNVTVGDVETAFEKFATKFDKDFLYRVGNANGSIVELGTMFKALDDVTIDDSTVKVSFETIAGNAAGKYTANTSTWTDGTVQFSGTGVIKVTIGALGAKDFDLYLEVVDATNLTSATGTTTGGNLVLLCDVNASNYVNYWNCTLYGNGFTYSLKGAPTAYNSKQGHGVLITKNATLDNLVIVGDVYNSYGAYTTQDYYNTAIDVVGETTIQNCYVANCAAPVKVRSADATIKNTTLYGGAVANLLIMSSTVTLEDVTTANYDDGRSVVGMGIVIHSDATESAKLVLNGTLTQYNFISESKVPTDTYAKNLHTAMFDNSCSQYHFGESPNRYVNTGIISLTTTFNGEDITDNANTGYSGSDVTLSSYDGYVYTQLKTSGSVNNNFPEYKPTTQGEVPPSYSFDYTNKNYVAKTDGSNDYCYEENGKVNISMDEGDAFNWDTSILTLGKGIENYTVTMNGTDYTGKNIAFNTAGDYEVTYTYTDANNFSLDENGNITTYSKTYTKTVNISVAVIEAATKHAEFTFGSNNTASTTVTIGNNTYVMPNVSATSSTIGSTTVDGKTIYYPIVEIVMSDGKTSHTSGWYAYFPVFSGAVTITDYADNGTGDKLTPYNGTTTTKPDGLVVVGDPTTLFKYQSGSAADSTPVVKNNILVYSSAKIEAKRSEYNTVVQYSYQDNAGATYYYYIGYHAPAQSYTSCIAPDTLVTLADGSQKRIDEVTFADRLLVWDFDKGEYTTASSSIIENHGYGESTVVKLSFEDGTEVKVVNVHGFFDADLNKWVDIDAKNAHSYVGHSFTQVDDDGYKTVKLVNVEISQEYIEAWSILSADHYNCILEGMFSITPPATEQLAFFEIGADMRYDAEAKQADIEQYGLYTYDEFAHLLTYEQFDALNIAEIKIAVGKGLITYEEILWLIATYIH